MGVYVISKTSGANVLKRYNSNRFSILVMPKIKLYVRHQSKTVFTFPILSLLMVLRANDIISNKCLQTI